MEIDLRVMKEEEHKYTFIQSFQIRGMTGLIGVLRGDFDTDGRSFFSTWEEEFKDLNSELFDKELTDVIEALRFDEDYNFILKDRFSLASCCYRKDESRYSPDEDNYGFRADTKDYSYLLRLNPKKGEYNFYIYCYKKEYLDHHIERAKRGIRFITPEYEELFRIKDGEKIRIKDEYGDKAEYSCRYVDDYHVEVGKHLYHICEFAERMQDNKMTVEPVNEENGKVRENKVKKKDRGYER